MLVTGRINAVYLCISVVEVGEGVPWCEVSLAT